MKSRGLYFHTTFSELVYPECLTENKSDKKNKIDKSESMHTAYMSKYGT